MINEVLLNNLHEENFSVRINYEYPLSKHFNVHDYMHGRCHIFAIIASEILGAPIQGYVAPHAEYDFALCHIYCRINKNTIIDASGMWNIYSMQNKYEEPGAYFINDGYSLKRDLNHMMKLGEIPNFEKNEIDHIIQYLEDLKKLDVLSLVLKEGEPAVNIEEILTKPDMSLKSKRYKKTR